MGIAVLTTKEKDSGENVERRKRGGREGEGGEGCRERNRDRRWWRTVVERSV